MKNALLIPPSSHFLKSLTNLFLDLYSLDDPNILKIWCIFPTKRSSLYFKKYLKEKAEFKKIKAGFFPRIQSFQEFIDSFYINLTDTPFYQVPDILRVFTFLEILEKKGALFEEKTEENLIKHFYWGLKFLEVFEEFEKEGRIPENLIYPPEGLPELAQKIFEELRNNYLEFTSLIEKKGFSYYSYRLKKVAEILKEKEKSFNLYKEIEEIWFIGFAALRNVEVEIFRFFKENFKSRFIFEAYEPLPSVIKDTLKALEIDFEWIPFHYHENKVFKEPQIYFYETTDPHLEVQEAKNLLPEKIENPDEVAIVVPNPLTLLPLIYSLEDKKTPIEVNITLQYPLTKIPLNQLLIALVKAQKEKEGEFYPVKTYLKILKHPYFLGLKSEEGISYQKIISEVEKVLREKGYLKITLEEVEDLVPQYKKFLERIHQIFFKDWEVLTPFKLSENLKNILNFFIPLFETLKEKRDWHSILLRNYVFVIETKILPIFEEKNYFKDKNFSKSFLLEILEHLLKEETIPFIGDPLKGLQIMGFLETRLLSFKKLIILDVNEGILPPAPSFNPLLTEEIKHYLGIPVFRNELWIYYFDRLIKSAEEVHLFYIFVEKGKTQEFREPSRFIQKLKWEIEKKGLKPIEKPISLHFKIFSEKEGIPKTEKDREYLLEIIKKEPISRYFLEIYLKCGAKFYFKYLLKLKEAEKIGLKPVDVGNFVHEFFERIFKEWEGKGILLENVYKEEEILEKFEFLWLSHKLERKMDALSHFFSKKIAKETIRKYFNWLMDKEKSGEIRETKILGVEKELKLDTEISLLDSFSSLKNLKVCLTGRPDFLIKRKKSIIEYLIFDFKSNPDTSPYTRKIQKLYSSSLSLPENFDRDSIYEIADLFGSNLYNFQLVFYWYLFYQQRYKFITEDKREFILINTGFITPSDLSQPEKLLLKISSRGKWAEVYKYLEINFKKLIEWILNHIIISDKFYYALDDTVCNYCEYKGPCKNYKYSLV